MTSTNSSSKSTPFWEVLIDFAPTALTIVFAAVVAGWPREIDDVVHQHGSAISLPFASFLVTGILAIGSSVVVAMRARQTAKRSEQQLDSMQSSLDESNVEIRELHRSQGFSVYISTAYALCLAASRSARDPSAAVRTTLSAIANTAWMYDGKPNARYASNVMLFRRRGTASQREQQHLVFCDHANEDLEGLLALQPDLSSAGTGDADPDPKVREIALPVPVPSKLDKAGKRRVLPGAPSAFVRRESELYSDAADLVTWCEKHGEFSLNVRNAIRAYLASADGKLVQSFVAVPLLRRGASKPLGVLNVHRDCPGILNPRPEQFLSLIDPLVELLSEILANNHARSHN
jgi:hypothetical protein